MRFAMTMLSIFAVLLSVVARCLPDDSTGECGLLSDTTETFQGGMPYCWSTHHMGNLKVLVVYPKDTCDTHDPPPTNYCWKEWTLADTMPQFAADLIVPDTIPANFPVKSLNHYYWTMSSGQYYMYGDYYPQMVVTDTCADSIMGGNFKYLNKHILEKIAQDSSFDFSDFDVSPKDSVVDMVFMVWRNDNDGHAYPSAMGPLTVETWDDMTIDGCNGVHVGNAGNLRMALTTIAHEFTHKMEEDTTLAGCFNGTTISDQRYIGPYGILDPADFRGTAMSAPERYRLCWLDSVITIDSDVLGLKIPDTILYGKAVKVYINDAVGDATDEYFLIENRQRTNWYSNWVSWDECKKSVLPGRGVLIWHVDESRGKWGEPYSQYRKKNDVESPSGLFDWVSPTPDPFHGRDGLDSLGTSAPGCNKMCRYDSLDFFFRESGNAFTPYTNPNSNGYSYNPDLPGGGKPVAGANHSHRDINHEHQAWG